MNDRYTEIKTYYLDAVNDLDLLKNMTLKKAGIVIMIDSLSQEYSNYNQSNRTSFCKFLPQDNILNDFDIFKLTRKIFRLL